MIKNRHTAIITGGSKRIGKEISRSLVKNNYNVIIHYNSSKKEAYSLCEELNKLKKKEVAIPVKGDLKNPNEIKKMFKDLKKICSSLNCLINNASTFYYDNLKKVTANSWNDHLVPNLYSPLVLSKEFSKNLPLNSKGNIINIIDQRVLNLTPHFLSYTLSKAGLWTLTQTLALELAPKIRVNAIGPGPTLKSKFQTDKDFKRQCNSLPLKTGANPFQVADTVLFLLKVESITGQIIALDGGQHLGWGQVKNNLKVLD